MNLPEPHGALGGLYRQLAEIARTISAFGWSSRTDGKHRMSMNIGFRQRRGLRTGACVGNPLRRHRISVRGGKTTVA